MVALLASLEARPESVRPVVPKGHESEQVPLSELLPRLVSGEAALEAWLAPSAPGRRDVIVAEGGAGVEGALLWLGLEGEKLERVERLPAELLAEGPLGSSFPRAAVRAFSAEHGELDRRARERLAREAAIFAALEDRSRGYRRPEDQVWVARGALIPWLVFYDDPPRPRMRVCELSEHEVRIGIARLLAKAPTASDESIPAELAARVAEAERALAELYERLLRGEAMLQRNTSVPMHWLWLDGEGYEVQLSHDGKVAAVERAAGLRPDRHLCANLVQAGVEDPRLRATTPELLAQVREKIDG